MEYEGGTVGKGGEVGAGGPDAQGGEGARRAGARRGSYPAGAQNNHTGGHSAVADGGWMRRALPRGASELLRGFVSTGRRGGANGT